MLDNTDCDDLNNLISPAALEVCNTIDDNCDGEIDEDFIYVQQYADMDGDDFGNPLIDTIACPNLLGFVVDSTDCNDTDPEIYPVQLKC
ncbi:MAG: putative metal-binding motif-containing protein [Bacteroidetes bacterium]|nr:putative metal-binding motif-containing protein [Bacteroidota bacterium]